MSAATYFLVLADFAVSLLLVGHSLVFIRDRVDEGPTGFTLWICFIGAVIGANLMIWGVLR